MDGCFGLQSVTVYSSRPGKWPRPNNGRRRPMLAPVNNSMTTEYSYFEALREKTIAHSRQFSLRFFFSSRLTRSDATGGLIGLRSWWVSGVGVKRTLVGTVGICLQIFKRKDSLVNFIITRMLVVGADIMLR